MKAQKGLTLIELMITSIIMVVIISATLTFILAGYSLSNKNFALARAENKLNMIQETIYYSIKNAGLVNIINDHKIEIYNRESPALPFPVIILDKNNNNLEMLKGDGKSFPSSSRNLSNGCDSIAWVFNSSDVNTNKITFRCTLKMRNGDQTAEIVNNVLSAHYRSLPTN